MKIKHPVPTRWRADVERVLINDEQIARRIISMARQIERDFRGRDELIHRDDLVLQ